MNNKVKHSAAHPGFEAAAKKIASASHYGLNGARAALAVAARNASAKAKKANPRLKRVKTGK